MKESEQKPAEFSELGKLWQDAIISNVKYVYDADDMTQEQVDAVVKATTDALTKEGLKKASLDFQVEKESAPAAVAGAPAGVLSDLRNAWKAAVPAQVRFEYDTDEVTLAQLTRISEATMDAMEKAGVRKVSLDLRQK